MSSPEHQRSLTSIWGELVVRAWDDEEFRKELLVRPRETLVAEGVELPDELQVVVAMSDNIEQTAGMLFLPFASPAATQLSDEELEVIAGGVGVQADLWSIDSADIGGVESFVEDRLRRLNKTLTLLPGPPYCTFG